MKKIVFTGPESTGKTTLATLLSNELNCPLVGEYSRLYLQNLNRAYNFDDITKIAKGQIANEYSALLENDIIICDTDLLVCKIWQEYKYAKVDPWIEDEFNNRRYNLLFLCKVDIPWVYDHLRENPTDREVLFNLYKSTLDEYNIDYIIVQGDFNERYHIVKDSLKKIGL